MMRKLAKSPAWFFIVWQKEKEMFVNSKFK